MIDGIIQSHEFEHKFVSVCQQLHEPARLFVFQHKYFKKLAAKKFLGQLFHTYARLVVRLLVKPVHFVRKFASVFQIPQFKRFCPVQCLFETIAIIAAQVAQIFVEIFPSQSKLAFRTGQSFCIPFRIYVGQIQKYFIPRQLANKSHCFVQTFAVCYSRPRDRQRYVYESHSYFQIEFRKHSQIVTAPLLRRKHRIQSVPIVYAVVFFLRIVHALRKFYELSRKIDIVAYNIVPLVGKFVGFEFFYHILTSYTSNFLHSP